MPVIVRSSTIIGYIILISVLVVSLLSVAAMSLFCLCRKRRHQPQHDAFTRSLPLSTFTPDRCNRQPSMPPRPPSSRHPSIPRTISSLRQKIRQTVERIPTSEVITLPAPVNSRHHQVYEIPGSGSSHASITPSIPDRPTKRPRESQVPPPRTRKLVPENIRLDKVYRHMPSRDRPPSNHPAFRNQASKSYLPQITVSSPSKGTTREAILEADGPVRHAVLGRMINGATEVVVGQSKGRQHINSAYAAHLEQKKARKPSMPLELYASDDGDGTTEMGDTPYMGAGGTPYIQAPYAPYIGLESAPYLDTPDIPATKTPPSKAIETPYINGFKEPPSVEFRGTRQVGAQSPLHTNTGYTSEFAATASTVSSSHFEQHRLEVVHKTRMREAAEYDYVRKGADHPMSSKHIAHVEHVQGASTPDISYRPLYVTARGGRRDYDKERAQEGRLRRLLESEWGASTTVTATDAGGGGGATPYMDVGAAATAAICPRPEHITNSRTAAPPQDPERQYFPMTGIRNAGTAVGRARGEDESVGLGWRRGRKAEILREAERRLEQMERAMGVEGVRMPGPLKVRDRGRLQVG
ncbi:hypothetical protein N7G274_004013 [Stereocaulon virgatum]|uniref:Uncharacterized protein n=1 Tax=Stereocaulon virgatum TaxID=373712 RepID=A0ABR4ABR9_9LECA